METIKVCRHPAASAHIGACVCTRSRGLLIPNPSLELTGQTSHYKTRHPSAGTQTRCAWFKCFSFFYPLQFFHLLNELQLKCVTDLIRQESLRGGGCRTAAAARSSLEPDEWFDARAAWGHFLLSSELHMAPHQEELNQRCRSPCVTLQQGQLSWIYLTWRLI